MWIAPYRFTGKSSSSFAIYEPTHLKLENRDNIFFIKNKISHILSVQIRYYAFDKQY